jgi:chemotaxis protein histidine kinase CheA
MQDDFNTRIEKVRQRFAFTLEGKIRDTVALLPSLSGEEVDAKDGVTASYRRIHGICGVAATVGFARTGLLARDVEDVLLAPYRAERGLTADEAVRLEKALDELFVAAKSELRSAYKTWQ